MKKEVRILCIFFQAVPIQKIPTKISQSAAIILMILNNLDPDVAQFPQGSVV